MSELGDALQSAMAKAQTIGCPEAVIFDWDNTLIDSWLAIQDAQNHTLISFGQQPWTLEQIKERVRGSMRDTYPQLFGNSWLEAGEIFYKRFAERHLDTLQPLAGAETLLQQLGERGVYLAVVSNKKGDYLRTEADRLGWNRYFGKLIGAFDAPRDKPAVDPVHMALEGSGIAAGSGVWFAGDANIDLECATMAGCIPILVREQAPDGDEFDPHPPAFHVSDCLMLSKVLLTL